MGAKNLPRNQAPLRKIVGSLDWNWRHQRPFHVGDPETILVKTLLECGHIKRPPSDTGREYRERARCERCANGEAPHPESVAVVERLRTKES